VIGYSDAVVSALKHHELDIALVASQTRDEDLRSQLLIRDRLVTVMSPRHPLAGRDVIHIQELGGEPLILLTAKSELRERVVAVFRRFHVALNFTWKHEACSRSRIWRRRKWEWGLCQRFALNKKKRAANW
jgi:DNA-binding transcriptional LysR family regulator